MKQTPSERQPNRGLTPEDPEFTCTQCREKLPMELAQLVKKNRGEGRRLTGRCLPCARALQRKANAKQAEKWRGPDYVLPSIKDQENPVVDGVRVCLTCGESKPVLSFYEDQTVESGYQVVCRVCRKIERKVRYDSMTDDQRELYLDQVWVSRIWFLYKLTVEDYERMADAQGWVCAICGASPGDRRLAVDHDHACCPGRQSCGLCLRQLLCFSCNTTLGRLETMNISGAAFDEYILRHARSSLDG